MKRRNLIGMFTLPFLGLGKKKEPELKYVGPVMWINPLPKKNMFGGCDEGNFPSNAGKRIKDCR
jgi:hypothetical protein